MSLSPATTAKKPLNLHNGSGASDTGTVTVTLSNAPSGASFGVEELGTPKHLKVSVSGNTITITAITGTDNRGNFTVRVTPSTGCGAAQDISVSVAK